MLPKSFYKFIILFLVTFLVCYYGFKLISGAAVHGGLYISFVDKYLNIASWIRQGLLFCTQIFLHLLNVESIKESEYVLKSATGFGIKLIFGCLGIAVYSFWIAYIVASVTNIKKKIGWLFLGLFLLWNINVFRISLVLLSQINKWVFPFGIDHHTWFNIVAYFFILVLIFFFEKNIKPSIKINNNES